MKTLINKTTKVAHYLWEDSQTIRMEEDMIHVGVPLIDFSIQFLNSSTGEIIENVTDPGDFWGGKYKYVDGQWVNNHPVDDGITYKWVDRGWTWEGRDDGTVPATAEWKATHK